MKLSEIAQKLACRLEGAPDTEIRGIAGIEHAEPGQITFLANRRYFPLLKTTRASAVLIEDGISLDRGAGSPPIAALRTPNPYLAFAHAIELFYQPPHYEPGIHATAIIARTMFLYWPNVLSTVGISFTPGGLNRAKKATIDGNNQ